MDSRAITKLLPPHHQQSVTPQARSTCASKMRVLSQGMGIRTACQRRFTSVSLSLAKKSAAHAAVDRFIATGDKVSVKSHV